mgnify:CR=1 FL=1
MFLEKAIKGFGDRVVEGARANLKRKDKNASGELSKSLGYDYLNRNQLYTIQFKKESYGKFIDKGVKGVGGKKADGSSWKTKKVFGSPYKYKNKKPPTSAFNGWTIRRGIAPRSKGGQFKKRKGLLFAISTSVYHTGLETTNFFTKPLENELRTLSNKVLDAYSLDIDEILKVSL